MEGKGPGPGTCHRGVGALQGVTRSRWLSFIMQLMDKSSAQRVLVSEPALDTWPQMPVAACGWVCDTEQV